jgi:hypothetical protein
MIFPEVHLVLRIDLLTADASASLSSPAPRHNTSSLVLFGPVPRSAANVLPSGENRMSYGPTACPSIVTNSSPVAMSHSLVVLSLPPDARVLLSGETAMQATKLAE